LSGKRTSKFNDSFFRIKVYTPNFNHKEFLKVFEEAISEDKISYCRCSKWNHKISFQHIKQSLIYNNIPNNTNSENLNSTNLVNVINTQS